MKKITCVGYHDTGSGAVDYYLREFSCISQAKPDIEFRILQDPDGISDLEYNLIDNPHRLNSGLALKRFRLMAKRYNHLYTLIFGKDWLSMVDEYINDLLKFTYKGWWLGDVETLSLPSKIKYKLKRGINYYMPKAFKKPQWYNYLPKVDTYHVSISRDDFLRITQDFIEKLCKVIQRKEDDIVVLDQAVNTANISRYTRYANDLKVIVVDRDPRDVYIHETSIKSHVLPKDPLKFCEVFRDSRKIVDSENAMNDSILRIYLEDLIYKYEETTDKLKKFVGVTEREHITPMGWFSSIQSRTNTRLWEKHPEYNDAVKIIVNELPEFLYKYDD